MVHDCIRQWVRQLNLAAGWLRALQRAGCIHQQQKRAHSSSLPCPLTLGNDVVERQGAARLHVQHLEHEIPVQDHLLVWVGCRQHSRGRGGQGGKRQLLRYEVRGAHLALRHALANPQLILVSRAARQTIITKAAMHAQLSNDNNGTVRTRMHQHCRAVSVDDYRQVERLPVCRRERDVICMQALQTGWVRSRRNGMQRR